MFVFGESRVARLLKNIENERAEKENMIADLSVTFQTVFVN